MTEATTAVANTVPAGVGAAMGIGMTYSMLGSWGYSRSRTTTAVLVSGVWNSFIKLGLPVLALALVALQGGATGGRVIAALLGIAGLAAAIVVFALMLRSEEQARRFGLLAGRVASRLLGLVRRPPVAGWERATVKFRTRTVGLVQGRWVAITVTSLVSHLSLYLVLLVTLRHVGVSDAEVSWAEVLAVFAFARLATAIPLTPGGAGFVEAVLIGGLVAAGGARPQVVAAVLVYRALTWLLPIPVGIGTYLWWRRRSLWRRPRRRRRRRALRRPDRPWDQGRGAGGYRPGATRSGRDRSHSVAVMGWNDAIAATASTSMSRSSRTSRRTSTAVLAGGCWVLMYWSRTSRTTGSWVASTRNKVSLTTWSKPAPTAWRAAWIARRLGKRGPSVPNASRSATAGNHTNRGSLALAGHACRGTVAASGKPSTKER